MDLSGEFDVLRWRPRVGATGTLELEMRGHVREYTVSNFQDLPGRIRRLIEERGGPARPVEYP